MARKKKVFCVEKDVGFEENRWIRQKGQFPTEADAQAWIDEVKCSNKLYRIVKEDQV
tara:strand:- start:625 stop:795 length:171 start_codon:yes stop_codon:yes gene_type:complete